MKYIDRLHAAIDNCKNSAMVGLDPRLDHLPEPFRGQAAGSASDAAKAVTDFHRALIDILAGEIAVIKPQSAFFEQLGAQGFAAMADACTYAQGKGLLVLMDAKRGDIGSTSKAYADTFLGGGYQNAFPKCDALTVNPFLGIDACEPFLQYAKKNNAGLYFLVKTSNPGAANFQNHGTPPLSEVIAAQVAEWSSQNMGDNGWSNIGAVVGATRANELSAFRELMPHTPLLLPGFGFQGGTADGLSCAFDSSGHGAVVNSSRGILWAHERPELEHLASWEDKTAFAVREMVGQLSLVCKS
ncbi:MAG: orotidine-5'-phosphate decarboxylase [Planctomycetes bacterium]|nr:orotidine-5'-phosphate decarboxylase [Planctomycetota bacterium]